MCVVCMCVCEWAQATREKKHVCHSSHLEFHTSNKCHLVFFSLLLLRWVFCCLLETTLEIQMHSHVCKWLFSPVHTSTYFFFALLSNTYSFSNKKFEDRTPWQNYSLWLSFGQSPGYWMIFIFFAIFLLFASFVILQLYDIKYVCEFASEGAPF